MTENPMTWFIQVILPLSITQLLVISVIILSFRGQNKKLDETMVRIERIKELLRSIVPPRKLNP